MNLKTILPGLTALVLNLQLAPDAGAARVVLVAGGGTNTNTTAPIKATEAKLSAPFGVDFDPAGNLCLVEMTGQRVRRLDKTGMLTVIAGTGEKGAQNGPGLSAQFNGIHNLAISVSQIFLADTWNNRVRILDLETGKVGGVIGTATVLAGYGWGSPGADPYVAASANCLALPRRTMPTNGRAISSSVMPIA